MVINVFGVSGGDKKPRRDPSTISRLNRPWRVAVNGRVTGAYSTRTEAEKFASKERRRVKTRGAVKVLKR